MILFCFFVFYQNCIIFLCIGPVPANQVLGQHNVNQQQANAMQLNQAQVTQHSQQPSQLNMQQQQDFFTYRWSGLQNITFLVFSSLPGYFLFLNYRRVC